MLTEEEVFGLTSLLGRMQMHVLRLEEEVVSLRNEVTTLRRDRASQAVDVEG